jgi:uncharacterized membrane protein
MEWVWHPFHQPNPTGPDLPNKVHWATGIWTLILTIIFCFLYGLTMSIVLSGLLAAPNPVNGLVLALVAVVGAAIPMWWTHDTNYRIQTDPAITLLLFATVDNGLFPALFALGAQALGYLSAGWVSRALIGSPLIANAATSASSYWMALFATVAMAFAYIYNDKFEEHGEKEGYNFQRTLTIYAAHLAAFTISFYGQGLYQYNAGLYLTAAMVSQNGDLTPGDGVLDWAFYSFAYLFVTAGAAFLLYILASLVHRIRKMVNIRVWSDTMIPKEDSYAYASNGRVASRLLDTTVLTQ